MPDLKAELEKLAADIVNEVTHAGDENGKVPLGDKIDALKACTALYAALNKHPGKEPDADDDAGFNFATGVTPEETINERTPVRSRPRHPAVGNPATSTAAGRAQ